MGGALAMLCALELRHAIQHEHCGPMHLYTFGAPSIGDSLFVQHMERYFPTLRHNEKYDQYLNRADQLASVHYRVQYATDISPSWLWRAFGSRHTGTLVWLAPLDEETPEGDITAAHIAPRVIGKDPKRKSRDAALKRLEDFNPTGPLRDHTMKSYVPAVVSHFLREMLGEAPYGAGVHAAKLVQQLAPPGSSYVAAPGVAAQALGNTAQRASKRRSSIEVRNAALLNVASLSSCMPSAPASKHSRVHNDLQQILNPLLERVAAERCAGSVEKLHEMAAQKVHSPNRWMHSEHDQEHIGALHPKAHVISANMSRKCEAAIVDVEPPFGHTL